MIIKEKVEAKQEVVPIERKDYETFKEVEMSKVDGSKVIVLQKSGSYRKDELESDIASLQSQLDEKQSILDGINAL